ncbi:hypothetical protein B0H67DRAFT_572626 [Lasiosphaeris hirsuta]|uniref:Uncharacterized protein n=1 Tax=Lasiosphaeris hirsuta TaxID=260670 RepID=A0AA40ANP2_9PEZI|nr:hypothetical protein B0H67DRAFT_572626 [Lasiosphaeris hirsuta]
MFGETIFKGAGVVLDSDGAAVRVWLRVYFTVALIIIALIGSKICVYRPQLLLLRDGRVPILQTTGWLSAVDAVRTMWLTRSNPLGTMGFVMILAGVVMTLSDLATSGLVASVGLPGRCAVNTSDIFYVIPTSQSIKVNIATTPASAQALDIRRQHETNMRNKGVPGIYRIIDNDDRFQASEEDIFGSWKCENENLTDIPVYPAKFTAENVTMDLFGKGLIYSDYNNSVVSWYYLMTGFEKDQVIWSQNDTATPDTKGEIERPPWHLKIAIQPGAREGEDIKLTIYHCALDAPAIDWIYTSTHDAFTQLYPWALAVVTHRYDQNGTSSLLHSDPIPVMEEMLNSMFMSMGSMHGEGNLRPDQSRITDDLTKGCLVPKSHIPWPVMLLFILVGLVLCWFVCYVFLLMHQLRRAQARAGALAGSPPTFESPVGFMPWLKHAVHKDGVDFGRVQTRTLSNWHLKYGRDGRALLAETNPTIPREPGPSGTTVQVIQLDLEKGSPAKFEKEVMVDIERITTAGESVASHGDSPGPETTRFLLSPRRV